MRATKRIVLASWLGTVCVIAALLLACGNNGSVTTTTGNPGGGGPGESNGQATVSVTLRAA
jgi:hypothetical protein